MTRKELSDLICAELPKLRKRDSAYPPEFMLAQWACELTDRFRTPIVVTLVPSTTVPGQLALIGYEVPRPATHSPSEERQPGADYADHLGEDDLGE